MNRRTFLAASAALGFGARLTAAPSNPRVRLNLEIITRDPLKVPCLTPKYWATLPTVPAKDLASALARVRRTSSRGRCRRLRTSTPRGS
jgi:hypothetical protein